MGKVTFAPQPPSSSESTCGVCGIAIANRENGRFCGAHRLEFERRQRNRVATEDLDTRWHDRLVNWRERPSALNEEPYLERLQFTRGAEPWILFMQGYPNRLPDWIAVDIPTNQIRRFVEINRYDLLDDLEGKRPAPNQDGLDERWGNSESRQGYLGRNSGIDGAFTLSSKIENAQMPVYGVSENPFGLTLSGTRLSEVPRGPDEVQLIFVSPGPVEPNIIVNFTSSRADVRRIKRPAGYGFGPDSDKALRFLTAHKPELISKLDSVSPGSITRHIAIPGFDIDTEILNWPEPINLFTLSLRDDENIFSVISIGLSEEELLQLSGSIEVVNDRRDLLQQYQAELGRNETLRNGRQKD